MKLLEANAAFLGITMSDVQPSSCVTLLSKVASSFLIRDIFLDVFLSFNIFFVIINVRLPVWSCLVQVSSRVSLSLKL